jgi:SAM-dependent methyltransferase
MAIETIHERYVKSRRVEVLAEHFAELLPERTSVLDVGCGDGGLAHAILERKPDLSFTGIDPLVREAAAIPVEPFDGEHIPFEDRSFEYVLLADVLHHTDDPLVLMREAARVASEGVLIKDHLMQGLFARTTLRFMDCVGNRRFGVSLPHNYWAPAEWEAAFSELGLTKESWITRLGLYPPWANWWFGRGLHFVARLRVSK